MTIPNKRQSKCRVREENHQTPIYIYLAENLCPHSSACNDAHHGAWSTTSS